MKFKKSGPIWTTAILIAIPLLVFLWIRQSGNFDLFFAWSQRNYWLFIVVLFLMKVLAMVYPPLPGGLFTLASIPVIGWLAAYIVDLAGSMAGSAIAYVIGKKYGFKLLEKLFDDESIQRLQKIKIKPHRELESVFMLRTLGGILVEIVAYGSGLLGIKFRNFIVGSFLSHLVIGIPTYYLASNIFSTQNAVFSAILLMGSLLLLWKAKGRYFE